MKKNQVKNRWMNAGRIIAVLALAMGMYGCPAIDDGNGEETPGGKIDSKIVGHWQATGSYWSGGYLYTAWYDYYFNKDGTFECVNNGFSHLKFTGKYSTSGGKVYFTDMKGYDALIGGGWSEIPKANRNHWEVVMEYKFATDSTGEYLLICVLGQSDQANFEVPAESTGYLFRKKK